MYEQLNSHHLIIWINYSRIPKLLLVIPISASKGTLSSTDYKPLCVMQLCKTLTSNTCRTNSTGPFHQQIQSSGKFYSLHYDASTAMNAKHLPNSSTNGFHCKITNKSTVPPPIICTLSVIVLQKQRSISYHAPIQSIKHSGKNWMTNY